MNLKPVMIPGIAVLVAGACLTFFADRFVKDALSVPKAKMLGVLLCAVGAVLTICL
ncbi:MAG: hypothetical protein IJ242_08335 [Clostridia bacterium]|nr:hypothetical protein [Clostridia bacterium]